MQLNIQGSVPSFPEPTKKIETETMLKANNSSNHYANVQQIQHLEQKNIVDDYFKTFDKSHTEIEIKNLIAARLQPSYQLPQIHDTKALSLKARELLDFSLSI